MGSDPFNTRIADMDSGQLLGGEIIGADAGELIHLLGASSEEPMDARVLAKR